MNFTQLSCTQLPFALTGKNTDMLGFTRKHNRYIFQSHSLWRWWSFIVFRGGTLKPLPSCFSGLISKTAWISSKLYSHLPEERCNWKLTSDVKQSVLSAALRCAVAPLISRAKWSFIKATLRRCANQGWTVALSLLNLHWHLFDHTSQH